MNDVYYKRVIYIKNWKILPLVTPDQFSKICLQSVIRGERKVTEVGWLTSIVKGVSYIIQRYLRPKRRFVEFLLPSIIGMVTRTSDFTNWIRVDNLNVRKGGRTGERERCDILLVLNVGWPLNLLFMFQ